MATQRQNKETSTVTPDIKQFIDVNGLYLTEGDCFGMLYSSEAKECNGGLVKTDNGDILLKTCHAKGLCQLVTQSVVNEKKVKEIKKAKGTLLDEIDVTKINLAAVGEYLKQYNGQVHIDALSTQIALQIKCPDRMPMVRLYLIGALTVQNFTLIKGNIFFNG